ncbi:MAG TPA: lysophospholipid acyltransferase family protein [Gammaproteobacteria bacterium]|nr:lysophospholipid acyltransferase family protein [Gammaproteobacteria bacterium]
MLFLRSLLFYCGMTAATLIFTPLSILLYPLPYTKTFSIIRYWAVFNIWWLKVTCNLKHEVTWDSKPPEGPAIIMCKHQSAWETIALQLYFPAQTWILKRELLYIPIYGWGLAATDPIAIDRGSAISAFRKIVEKGCERLARGIWVVVFPEGTRVAPGERGKYLPGGGMLAEKSGKPVVPVAHNAGYFWPRQSFIKRPGTIHMIIGPVIETAGRKATDITAEVEQWIESKTTQFSLQETGH